jgi:hypothetical protein
MAAWSNVISSTEKEITQLKTAMARAEVTMDKAVLPTTRAEAHSYWLDVKAQLTSAQARLKTYQVASVAGKIPPDIARYMVITQTPTEASIASMQKMLNEIDDWLKGKGAYKPVVSPESQAGTSPIATAVRTTDKIVVPKVVPQTKLIATYAEVAKKVKVKAPTVTAPAKVSVFPGITAPIVRVTTRTTTTTVPAEHIGAMTPEQARRLYGEEIQVVEAVSPYVIPVEKVKPAEWLSPAQAIKAAQRIAIQSYTQQVIRSATKLAAQMKAQAATRAQIKSAVRQAIQSQVQTITTAAMQTQVLKAVQTTTIITEIVGTAPIVVAPAPPVPPLPKPPKKEVKEVKVVPGLLTWRQGTVTKAGKRVGVWYVVKSPYRTQGDLSIQFERPVGAEVVKGRGSAYQTIQLITGKPPDFLLHIDMGAMDVLIHKPTRKPGKKTAIRFRKDPKRKTTGHMAVGKITPRLAATR